MYRCGSTRPFFTDTLNPLPCHGSVCRARRSSISYRSYRFGNNASDLLKQAILAIELKILLATTHFGDEESFSFQAPKLFRRLDGSMPRRSIFERASAPGTRRTLRLRSEWSPE